MVLRNLSRNVKAEATTFLLPLRREERLKNDFATVFGYPGSVVRYGNAGKTWFNQYFNATGNVLGGTTCSGGRVELRFLNDPV